MLQRVLTVVTFFLTTMTMMMMMIMAYTAIFLRVRIQELGAESVPKVVQFFSPRWIYSEKVPIVPAIPRTRIVRFLVCQNQQNSVEGQARMMDSEYEPVH